MEEKFIRFDYSLPGQVREMITKNPIAYVPFGALEWHSEHAALGLDGIKSGYICEAAAAKTGGVLFPVVYYSAFNTMRFPFTFHFAKSAAKKQVREILNSLAGWGFKSIVLLTGHYPLAMINLLRRECRRISRRRGVAALGIPEQALALDLGYYGDHAGKWETSLLMAIDERLIDLDRLPADTGTLDERGRNLGIFGICPKKETDAELGRKALDLIINRLAEAALRMAEEGNPAAAEAIYREYAKAFSSPLAAGRIAYGVDSAYEIIRFTIMTILRQRHL